MAAIAADDQAVRPPRRQRSLLHTVLGRTPAGWLFVAPYAAFVLLIFAYPLGFAIWISFHDWFFTAPGAAVSHPWTGLQNYADALSDPLFRRSLWHVGVFVVINVPITVVGSLVLATALNTAVRGKTFFRAAYYVPYVAASVAVVAVWLWMFSGNGLLNSVLGGLAPDPTWLVNSSWAMPIIAFFATWKGLGFYVLVYLAALQNVPKELHEAAKIDGATTVQRFRSVTVPGVRPATLLVLITATVTGASFFTEPYLLTGQGGPDNASVSPVLLMYREAITQNHPGYAAAIGVMLAVVVLVISAIYRLVLEKD